MASGLTTEDLRRLMNAGVINRKSPQKRRNPTYGTVSSVSPFQVILDGDTEALPYSPARLFDGCSVGDRVYCVYVGNEILCTGIVQSFQPPFKPIGVNSDGRVELDWTSGGIRGRVIKQLWSGSWSANGSSSITVPESDYYSLFLLKFSGRDARILGIRNISRTGGAILGTAAYTTGAANSFTRYAVSFNISGNVWSDYKSVYSYDDSAAVPHATVLTSIEGVI